LEFLPPKLLVLAQEADDALVVSVDASSADAAKQALSLERKKVVLHRVLRSPQFSQSLSSLTIALRDGGLPSISEALNINVQNGGFMRRGGVPLGGGDAVEAFLNGVKDQVKKSDPQVKNQMAVD
jgi:26S proteasome regulatory subunit N13